MALLQLLMLVCSTSAAMEEKERRSLRLEAADMFYHGFDAYMSVAWPADELMPLSCKGRVRYVLVFRKATTFYDFCLQGQRAKSRRY